MGEGKWSCKNQCEVFTWCLGRSGGPPEAGFRMQIKIKADCKCTHCASAAQWASCQLSSDPGCSNPPVSASLAPLLAGLHHRLFCTGGMPVCCSTNTDFPVPLTVENSVRNTCQKEAFTTFHMFSLKNREISDPFHTLLPLLQG